MYEAFALLIERRKVKFVAEVKPYFYVITVNVFSFLQKMFRLNEF